ncbi:MAG: COG1470 family protein, partial [Nostoc sp.]
GIQYGIPGDIVSLYAVVINEGDQSAVIDLFFTFDETFQKISGWYASPKASLAVAPKESSSEVTFDFQIPVDALAGTYDYTFVVDSPEHYPEDTPINFPGQLKVLLKEQTVIRAFDPTFSIIPPTNPNKLITYRLDQPLKVVIKVENRSNRVDRFRLTCPDLDENWYKISYPASGFEGVGLFDVSALELNPNSEGEIYLEFRPPIDTLAGTYSPTIRLLSENNPDLTLLDLIYINLPSNYQLGIELHTILGKVSHKNGIYELVLNNQGNLIRELFF